MIVRSLPITQKNRAHNKLLAQGQANVEELFAIEYGEWPPKGLDVDGTARDVEYSYDRLRVKVHPTQNIFRKDFYSYVPEEIRKYSPWFKQASIPDKIRGSRDLFNYLMDQAAEKIAQPFRKFHSVAGTAQPATVSLQPFHSVRGSLKTSGHEGVHVCQFQRSQSMFDPEELISTGRDRGVGKTMERIMARTETPDQTAARHKSYNDFDGVESSFAPDYLSKEIEMQCRMHTMMAQGYSRWGKLPVTKVELFAALKAQGVEMPPTIEKELASTEEGRKAMQEFRPPSFLERTARELWANFRKKDPMDPDVRGFNGGFNSFTESQREEVGREVFPKLYATLIEFYGDKQGRERFGLGKSRTAERQMFGAVINENRPDVDYQNLAPQVAPENAGGLAAWAVATHNSTALVSLLDAHPRACKEWSDPHGPPGRCLANGAAMSADPRTYSILAERGMAEPNMRVTFPNESQGSILHLVLQQTIQLRAEASHPLSHPGFVEFCGERTRKLAEFSSFLVQQGANAAERVTIPGENGKPDQRLSLYELARRADIQLPPAPVNAPRRKEPDVVPPEDQNLSLIVRPQMGITRHDPGLSAKKTTPKKINAAIAVRPPPRVRS